MLHRLTSTRTQLLLQVSRVLSGQRPNAVAMCDQPELSPRKRPNEWKQMPCSASLFDNMQVKAF